MKLLSKSPTIFKTETFMLASRHTTLSVAQRRVKMSLRGGPEQSEGTPKQSQRWVTDSAILETRLPRLALPASH